MTQRPQTYGVCGVQIAAVTPDGAVQAVLDAVRGELATQVHLCNAYTLSLAAEDPELSEALQRSDLNLPDGAPVAWLGRRKGTEGPVRGPTLMAAVVRAGEPQALRHYLYGAAPTVAARLKDELVRMAPRCQVVGFESPDYGALTDTDVLDLAARLEATDAQIVWIGLGTPKQDHLVPRLAAHTRCTIVPVGAAFDFLTGNIPQAPMWLHGTGLEWAYRLWREPRRLWRRYMLGNPKFIWHAVSQHVRRQ